MTRARDTKDPSSFPMVHLPREVTNADPRRAARSAQEIGTPVPEKTAAPTGDDSPVLC